MKNKIMFAFLIMVSFLPLYESASILIVAPFFGTAHIKIMQTLTKVLHEKSHNITIITINVLENPPKNYRQIKVEKNLEDESDASEDAEISNFAMLNLLWDFAIPSMKFVLNSPEVQDFIKNDDSHFDLIINEVFYQEFGYVFGQKYKAPVVVVDTTLLFHHIGDFMGNPMPITYAAHEAFTNDVQTLFGKLENILLTSYDRLGRRYFYLPKVDKLINEYFSCWNITLPKVEDMEKQVALALINSHYLLDSSVPLVPGIVRIGGIHIQPVKPLRKDIQQFLDDSKEGAIYFSLGSYWKTKYLGEERLNSFIDAFKQLKKRVIWKVDQDIPKIENVLTGNWFEQNDILAHPNVKLFISHCGMLSTQETIYHGVPVIGVPLFWDQFSNIFQLHKFGAAMKLDYLNVKTEDIVNGVNEVFNNPEYMKNVKILSNIYKDRLNDPKDLAVYWIEYVIRNNGSKILKSPVVEMSFLENYLVEIILIFSTLLCTLFLLFILKLNSKSTLKTCNIKTKENDKKQK